jgi:DeoR/GlpR family transcriptional regulator of sugar metabolism
MASRRVDGVEYAERINVAAQLVETGISAAVATKELADRFSVSLRQARRYVDQAASSGRIHVPEASVVFTVKLPAALAERVRAHAREREITISAAVARALTEFLTRGRREDPGR